MKANRKIWFIAGIVLFIAYFFLATRSVPLETVLIPCWLNSVESGNPLYLNADQAGGDSNNLPQRVMPFSLGRRFGYISRNGVLSVNQVKKANVSLSPELWAEYEAEPERIVIYNHNGEVITVLDSPRGYPFFLDGRTFLVGSEQNVIAEIGGSGEVFWTYEFASPLTCVDSAAGLLLVGSLDGMAGLLDQQGNQVFSFEPGGSQYSIILGCAISRDGSRLAIISGIDDQRFLILEHFGASASDYKVVYHEFIGEGFRRPVYISFIENDSWVVFERGGGLGFYEIKTRKSAGVELNGELCAIDNMGGQGIVFAVISRSESARELIGIRLPDQVIIESLFRSEDVFLGRMDSRLIIGGGQTLASFDMEKR